MNELIQKSSNELTMSSREIAALCDKEHSNVLRDIRVMLINLYGDEYVRKTIPEHYRNRHSEYIRENADRILTAITGHSNRNDEQNQTFRGYKWQRDNRGYITEICLDKDHTLTLISGYNTKLRMAIIKRWQELEQATTQKPVPLTFAEALRAYADEVEAHEQTKQTLAIAEPKAQYFDKLVERNLLTNFTTTAKEFGIKRKDFINYLLSNGYIYRDQQGNLLPYAVHVPHLFEVKEYSKGAHSGVQTLVTPKGRETLRLLLT